MIIYNKKIFSEAQNLIIESVREKKRFFSFDKRLILQTLRIYCEQNTSDIDQLNAFHKNTIKKVVKFIRSKYHGSHEIFMTMKTKDRMELLSSLSTEYSTSSEFLNELHKLMELHISTKERFTFYSSIYSKLYDKISFPKSILDISCGHNPLSLALIPDKFSKERTKLRYDVTELCEQDVEFAKSCLTHFGLKSQSYVIDLVNEFEMLSSIPHVDVCYIFKVLDVVETSSKNITYKILDSINADYIICSFPTKNIRNIDMRLQNRPWLERMCGNLGFTYETFKVENEIFYIVNKGKK